jgi:hypothetical protein
MTTVGDAAIRGLKFGRVKIQKYDCMKGHILPLQVVELTFA